MLLLPSERAQVEAVLLRSQPELAPRVDALFREYARFLALKLALEPAPVTPCKAVDAVWHAHLLCTRAYAALCERENKGAMIHHEPGIGSEESYAETLAAYESAFGEPPPRSVWGRAKMAQSGV
jgi:hypothetical protein